MSIFNDGSKYYPQVFLDNCLYKLAVQGINVDCDRTDISEGIDTDKTDSLFKCIICHYYYFLGINCRFQPKICDGCNDNDTIHELEWFCNFYY